MPTLADLDQAMLQLNRAVPAARRVGGGSIALAGRDRPFRVLGRHAVVYQLNQPSGGAVALRVPLGERSMLDPTLPDRYRALGTDLTVAALRRANGPIASGLAYYADGLSLAGADFRSAPHPLMVMEWIKGPTLLAAVDQAARAGETGLLSSLAESWATAVARLVQAGFSHGDLTADNVMVRPGGEITLVDYDTCVWPNAPFARAMAHAPSATELLPPGYAHPAGTPPPLEQRDDFPALVIYASLQVLARWPQLREKFGDSPARQGGVLLFSATDLVDPQGSDLVRAIMAERDPLVTRVMTSLIGASTGPVAGVPPLHDVVAEVRMVASRRQAEPPRRRADWQPERHAHRTAPWPTAPRPADEAPLDPAAHWPDAAWGSPAAAAPQPAPPLAPESHWPQPPAIAKEPPSRAAPPPDAADQDRATAREPWRGPSSTEPARPAASRREAPPARPPRASANTSESLARQRKLTQLNLLLLNGDETNAERFWHESGLATDPQVDPELGLRIGDIRRRHFLALARTAIEAGDAAGLVRAWTGGDLENYPPATPLRPLFERAQSQSASPARLEAALAAKDVATVRQLWTETRAHPRAAMQAVRVQALLTQVSQAAISAALRRGDDAALLTAAAEAQAVGVPLDATSRRAASHARQREATRRTLNTALAIDDRSTLAQLAITGQLADLGPLEPAAHRAVKRAVAWPHLERAFTADDDAEIRASYDASLFDDPTALTPAQRARVDLARRRLGWLAQVRAALRQRDGATIRAALNAIPDGADRFLTAVERQRLLRLASPPAQ